MKILAIAIVAASACSLIGCAAPAGFSYQNVKISLAASCSGTPCSAGLMQSPVQPNLILVNNYAECILFDATVTNAPPNFTWTLYPTPNLTTPGLSTSESGSSVGALDSPTGVSNYYCENGIPTYTGAALLQAQAMGIQQGQVIMVVSVPIDPSDPTSVASTTEIFQIYSESTPPTGPPAVHLTPVSVTSAYDPVVVLSHLAPNNTFQFTGFAVGAEPCMTVGSCTSEGFTSLLSTDNAVVWAVAPYVISGASFAVGAPVVGGNSTEGTITQTGLYTAPATIPLSTTTTGPPVVVLESHLAPTIVAYADITVN
jgi:hypothetical protein